MIEQVQWDSDNFGIKIGNIVLAGGFSEQALLQAINKAKDEEYDLLYLKGYELSDAWLSDKFLLADKKVVYSQTIKEYQMQHSEKIGGTCIILCLGIDVSKSKQEELDIYDTMQLCPE